MARPHLSGGPEFTAEAVANQAAMLALTGAEIGHLVLVTDTGKRYVRNTITSVFPGPSLIGEWLEVASINATDLTNVPAGGIAAVTVQGAINELDTEKGNAVAIAQAVVALVGAGALAAQTSADETLVCAGLGAGDVILGVELSAAPVAGAMFGPYRNDAAGNVVIRYGNITAAPIAVAADAAVVVTFFDPATW